MVNRQMGHMIVQQQQRVPSEWRCKNADTDLNAVIEQGMKGGSTITFPRMSEQTPGKIPGDIVVTLKQKPHDRFERTGDDLRTSLRRQLRKKRRGGRFSRATPVDVCAALAARDEAREGRLERAAFDRALARAPLGLKLERGQAAALTRKFRLGDDGVDYVAFAKWLGPDAAGPAAWAFGDKDQRALRRRLATMLSPHTSHKTLPLCLKRRYRLLPDMVTRRIAGTTKANQT